MAVVVMWIVDPAMGAPCFSPRFVNCTEIANSVAAVRASKTGKLESI